MRCSVGYSRCQARCQTLVCECQALGTQPAPDAPAGFGVQVNYCLRGIRRSRFARSRLDWTAAACLRLLACSLQASGGETGKGTASWVGYQKLPPSLLVLILFGICISSLRPVNYVHKLYKQTCQVASMTWTQRCLQRYHYHTRT